MRSLGFFGLFTLVQYLFIFSPFRCHKAWDLVYALLYFFFSRYSISLSSIAAFVRVGGDVSRSSSCQVWVKSFLRALMRCEILGICFLAALVASLLISFLKFCHSVCALEDLSSGGRFSMSRYSCRPFWLISLFRSLSFMRPRGQDHLSVPIRGVLGGGLFVPTPFCGLMVCLVCHGTIHLGCLLGLLSHRFCRFSTCCDPWW